MSRLLWGSEFSIPSTPDEAKRIKQKLNTPKVISEEQHVESIKKLSVFDRLEVISAEVHRVLGKFENDTVVIRDELSLREYLQAAVKAGVLAVDTETNNSLDPLTCKIMGLCLYTPGQKNAYIPINHTDVRTGIKLSNQVSESQIKSAFLDIDTTEVTNVFHNGKFDYQVLKCTCGISIHIDWDTMIGAQILNENEKSYKLKDQYIAKIDSSIEHYSIDKLFEDIQYEYVDPEIFALYAATDSYLTFKLYQYQKSEFEYATNKELFNLFKTVEVPIVEVCAEMELAGVTIDTDYAKRLSVKYQKLSEEIDKKINITVEGYVPQIELWRNTKEALQHAEGKKSKAEQLKIPMNIASPLQLSILLYDVLKIPSVSTKTPRGTGEDILTKIKLPLCELILQKRGIDKLRSTYIDKLPECISPTDNKLHAEFNQLGAGTGRFSSSSPNLQNIPSHENSIRMMFTASTEYHDKLICDDTFTLYDEEEVNTINGWIKSTDLIVSDVLIGDDVNYRILCIEPFKGGINIYVKCEGLDNNGITDTH